MNRFMRIKRVYDDGETGPFIVNQSCIQAVLPYALNRDRSLMWIHGFVEPIIVDENFEDLGVWLL